MTPRMHYHSRRCRQCDRDYLYPFYGGWAICNDCKMTDLDDESPK